jgi:hypothetical protein
MLFLIRYVKAVSIFLLIMTGFALIDPDIQNWPSIIKLVLRVLFYFCLFHVVVLLLVGIFLLFKKQIKTAILAIGSSVLYYLSVIGFHDLDRF